MYLTTLPRAWRRLRQRRLLPFDWARLEPELSQTSPYDWAVELPSLRPPLWHEGVRLLDEAS